jgi:hypothetical protein
MASKLRFPHTKKFLQKLLAIWACAPQKSLTALFYAKKFLKHIGSKGRQTVSLLGAPNKWSVQGTHISWASVE